MYYETDFDMKKVIFIQLLESPIPLLKFSNSLHFQGRVQISKGLSLNIHKSLESLFVGVL